jgi:aromatic ring-opening dioxygenase catalytic subunit (LigB family)
LILSGGLTIHNLRDFDGFLENATSPYKAWDDAVLLATSISDVRLSFLLCIPADIAHQPEARKKALIALTQHRGFRAAHPREEHFVPLYVAAGAGDGGSVSILSALWGAPTVAFGL